MSGDEKPTPPHPLASRAAPNITRAILDWEEAHPGKKPTLQYAVVSEEMEGMGEAADFPPYTYGERRRNPYYTARRDIWRYKDGEPVELMISKHADVTDILQAYDVDYQLAEVIAKILRLSRKQGTHIRQEFTKMHEHIQAAEDAWVAEEGE